MSLRTGALALGVLVALAASAEIILRTSGDALAPALVPAVLIGVRGMAIVLVLLGQARTGGAV